MATIYFDVEYPDGTTSERQEFSAGSDRHMLHYLASLLNNMTDQRIKNVAIY